MRSVLPLAVAATLAIAIGAAAAGGPGGDAPRSESGQASPSLVSAGGPGPGPTERALVLKPGDQVTFPIVANGGPLVVLVKLNHGASLGGTLRAPAGCLDDPFMTTVIGVAYEGQTVASIACDVAAGPLTFMVDGAQSAFVGSVRLEGATFQAA